MNETTDIALPEVQNVEIRIPTVKLKIPGSSGFGFAKKFSRNFQFHRRDPSEETIVLHEKS